LNAADILTKAASLVGGDRQQSHGPKLRNHANIAALWNAYLTIRREPSAPLSPVDVTHMMVLLKLARTQLGSLNPDDYVDMAGYAGCSGEIAAYIIPDQASAIRS
jgi:hypothetical protein